MRSNNLRFRAIYLSLKQGFLPWQLFEKEVPYSLKSYFQNLPKHLKYAWKWATYKEDEEDREYINENFSK